MNLFLSIIIAVVTLSSSIAHPCVSAIPLDNGLEAKVYAISKKGPVTQVEIGFKNTTDKDQPLSLKGIYLNSDESYSTPPLSQDEARTMIANSPNKSFVPGAVGLGLGVAGIVTGVLGGPKEAVAGLLTGAAASGIGYYLSQEMSEHAKDKRLLTLESSHLDKITHIPAGMTLGGVLYFPKSKRPTSVSVVTASDGMIVIPFADAPKKSRRTRTSKY